MERGPLIIVALVLSLLIILGGTALFMLSTPPKSTINVKLSANPSIIEPGNELSWKVNIRSSQSSKAELRSELWSNEKKRGFFSLADSVSLKGAFEKNYKANVPQETVPGNYQLRVFVDSANKRAIAIQPVVIMPVKSQPLKKPVQPKDQPKTVQPPAEKPAFIPDSPVQPAQLYTSQSSDKSVQPVIQQSAVPTIPDQPSDPKLEQCNEDPDWDSCVLGVAISISDASLCSNIKDVNSRDSCYSEFIFAGDSQYCRMIVNSQEVKNYCEVIQ